MKSDTEPQDSKAIPKDRIQISCSAPGKLIFAGEHSVCYGKKAMACSIDLRTVVKLTQYSHSSGEERLTISLLDQPDAVLSISKLMVDQNPTKSPEFLKRCAQAKSKLLVECWFMLLKMLEVTYFKENRKSLNLEISSELPIGAGLGSSASLCVALSGCLHRLNHILDIDQSSIVEGQFTDHDLEEINRSAYELEKIFHGKPSGIDNSVSCYGDAMIYQRFPHTAPTFQRIEKFPKMKVIVINTNVSSSTKAQVQKVREKYDEKKDFMSNIMDSMNFVVEALEKALVAKGGVNHKEVCNLIRANSLLLDILGVSHPKINKILEISAKYDYPAKLTGAGGGGCCFAIYQESAADGNKLNAKYLKELEDAGFQVLRVHIGGKGLCVESQTVI